MKKIYMKILVCSGASSLRCTQKICPRLSVSVRAFTISHFCKTSSHKPVSNACVGG